MNQTSTNNACKRSGNYSVSSSPQRARRKQHSLLASGAPEAAGQVLGQLSTWHQSPRTERLTATWQEPFGARLLEMKSPLSVQQHSITSNNLDDGNLKKSEAPVAKSQLQDMHATNPAVSRSTSSCTAITSEGAADSRAVHRMWGLTSEHLRRKCSSHQPLVDSREPEPDSSATRIDTPTTSGGAVFSKVCHAPRVQQASRREWKQQPLRPPTTQCQIEKGKRPYLPRNPQSTPRFTHVEETVSTHAKTTSRLKVRQLSPSQAPHHKIQRKDTRSPLREERELNGQC